MAKKNRIFLAIYDTGGESRPEAAALEKIPLERKYGITATT
jgi:hypothetical protein